MKTTLKTIAIVLLSFALAASVRVGLRRWFPGMYASIWGEPSAHAKMNQPPPISSQRETGTPPLPLASTRDRETASTLPDTAPLEVTGILMRGERVIVVLSDGSVRTEQDNRPGKPNRLDYVTRTYAEWDGKRYWLKPRISTGGNILQENQNKGLTVTTAPP